MENVYKILGVFICTFYNVYDDQICFFRVERKLNGNVYFYDIETNEVIDLENYGMHGYKYLKDTGGLIDINREYTVEELKRIEEEYNNKSKSKKESDSFYDLGWLNDQIEGNSYNYDLRYPVEQIEIRYNSETNDYMILYVKFNDSEKRLSYMDISNGVEVNSEILEQYSFYPRDNIFDQADYSPRELVEIRDALNKGLNILKKRKR